MRPSLRGKGTPHGSKLERRDLAAENDAARLARSQALVKQILTGMVCPLEAAMIQNPLDGWNLNELDFLFIENVGNLVCPSSYDLGADLRFVLVSVTEGEDKPLKYLTIFNSADVAVITKSDLAAAEFDEGAARANIVYFILVFYYIKDRKTLIPFQIVNILRSRVAATMHLSFSRVSGNLYPRNIKWLLETVSL